jgi:hypothetical protein
MSTKTVEQRVMKSIEKEADGEDRYQHWVYRHPVGGAAVAAFIATQVGTIWGYYAKGIGLPSLPFPNYNGALFAPASVAKDFSNFGNTGSFFVGQSIHMVNGIVPRGVDSASSASAPMCSAPIPITGSYPSPSSCGI